MGLRGVSVSRETIEALEGFTAELLKWTKKINLIAPSTAGEAWTRHIEDSAQLWGLRPERAGSWCDLGSGGGLPALVLAILAKESDPETIFTLIESDNRKCAFLTTVISKFDLRAEVKPLRIEAAPPAQADVVSARALAPLATLLEYAERHVAPKGTLLLQKGAQYQNEIDAARKAWHFKYESIPSMTSAESVVLKIQEVSRV